MRRRETGSATPWCWRAERASLWPDDEDTVLLGMHGSLEADEMRVPLLALPLG